MAGAWKFIFFPTSFGETEESQPLSIEPHFYSFYIQLTSVLGSGLPQPPSSTPRTNLSKDTKFKAAMGVHFYLYLSLL